MKSSYRTLFIFIFLAGCSSRQEQKIKKEYPESLTTTIKNSLNLPRADEAVFLKVKEIKSKAPGFNENAAVIFCNGKECASQVSDIDGDGYADVLASAIDFKSEEKKKLTLHYAQAGIKSREYRKRTQAELSIKVGGQFVNRKYIDGAFQNVQFLRVPPEHTDHSEFIRYEGPGWESDKVGYRFYLDWRNAIDIYGKKIPDMVLHNVGQDGYDSYHAMADWGMDILKVGESLGIGSLGVWHDGKAHRVSVTDSTTCEIIADGPVFSAVRTKYFGWKVGTGIYNVTSDLTITAGSRLTKHEITITGEPENLCTGIVKHEQAHVLHSERSGEWNYLALFGKQSLADDNLGMAVLYKSSDLTKVTADEFSHVVVLKPDGGKIIYYFLAAWEREPQGIKSEEAFVNYLNATIECLNSPVMIAY